MIGKRRSVKADLLPFIERGDVVQIGRLLVQAIVNMALRHLVTMQLVSAGNTRVLALGQMAKSLLGLAWLRLAEAASGDRIPRRCPRCKSWFMIAAATRRGHGIYCSPKCRSSEKRDAFIALLRPCGLRELVRSDKIPMVRGLEAT